MGEPASEPNPPKYVTTKESSQIRRKIREKKITVPWLMVTLSSALFCLEDPS